MYLLHLALSHQKIIDSIQVLAIEEIDLNLSPSISQLNDLHLRPQRSSEFGLRRFDVRINRAWRRRRSRRLLLVRLLDE
jgi:hypothetical protein